MICPHCKATDKHKMSCVTRDRFGPVPVVERGGYLETDMMPPHHRAGIDPTPNTAATASSVTLEDLMRIAEEHNMKIVLTPDPDTKSNRILELEEALRMAAEYLDECYEFYDELVRDPSQFDMRKVYEELDGLTKYIEETLNGT